MATINYNIDSGTPPFTASINPAVAGNNIHESVGSFYFTNIPNGEYVISIVDSEGCQAVFNASVDCSVTTTTTTLELVESCEEYGLLYNWYAAVDERKITSSDDWIVPRYTKYTSGGDFEILCNYLGGRYVAGGKMKEIGFTYWDSPNTGATNESKFNARGTGVRGAFFYNKNQFLHLWTNCEAEPSSNAVMCLLYTSSADFYPGTNVGWDASPKYWGQCIRLVRTSTLLTHGQTGTYTGNDGKTYRTICIDTQEWVADNIQETRFRNGDIIPYHGESSGTSFTDAEWQALTTPAMSAYNNDLDSVGCDFTFPTTTTTTTTIA